MRLVHHWLSSPPTKELVRGGVACLRSAAIAADQPDFGTDDLLHMLWDAESMTRKAAILSGKPYQVSEQQHDALLELAQLLQVDSGVPWLDLLMELGGRPEAEHTLPKDAQVETRQPVPSAGGDRLRRWRTALRLHASHDHRVAPGGGLI